MTRDQFFEQVMIRAVARGYEQHDLDRIVTAAEYAWTLLNPPPVPKPADIAVRDAAEKILRVLRDGSVSAVGGDMPIRVRDVLLQAMRRKYGVATGTVRLHAALRELEAAGAIRWTDDRRRLELA